MLSKCANPACSEKFLRLHQGKIFHLSPTPEVEAATGGFAPALYERFWLCDRCSKQMTVVWGGTEAKLVPLPKPAAQSSMVAEDTEEKPRARRRTASGGLQWR
ncbi:MAG TPA: hypothetical protein VMG82_23590 [Candidatus Sulfotelmatobacter sp.]|nr:hypothetical protein [Candidatus Sulfotelmatobacter sp.]